ncbi:Holliday junction branch migration protein RuvA [Sphingomicrobium clamense]|uniref:Holliday junction branch migration complex subunit RuvA n=1 Tax=Sphingomicrobium clamense TaxID=2851013 RepID=A0ABS6V8Z2_9SPHN|nr:Holliday junction branch migration protein RuvA [Sphingomicrobium sp. B8]MBW0145820.1 Holliday junction branch migration protein RuvA [Sphingomicrobium sp. B8]
MIARLTGKLLETTADTCVLDVQGVGYLVHISGKAIQMLGPVGGHVALMTELQVREDAMTLYGFANAAERDAFRALTGVQGVGGRVALAILTVMSPDELAAAVSTGDQARVAQANGVGPKLASRIVNELAGKLGDPAVAAAGGANAPKGSLAADAVAALTGLGFKPAPAQKAVAEAQRELEDDASLDALVRAALKKVGK